MRKVEFPRVPGFKTEREAAVQAMVVRRCRLWQRLIEIGAYWEKVSGSKSLAASAKGAAQNSRRQAAAAAAAAAAGHAAPDQNGVQRSGGTTAASGAGASAAGGGGTAAAPRTAVAGAGGTGGASGLPAANSRQAAVAMEIDGAGGGGGGGAAAPQSAAPAASGRKSGTGEAATNPTSEFPTPIEMDRTGAEPEIDVDVGLDGADPISTMVGEAWTYAAVGNLNVVWYCPPGGGEADRLSNRAQLVEYWQRKHGHTQVPGWFTFRGKDAPAHWKRTQVGQPSEDSRPAKKAKADAVAAAAAAAADGAQISGVHDLSCVYCGEQAGPRVNEHLEQCYRMVSSRLVGWTENIPRSWMRDAAIYVCVIHVTPYVVVRTPGYVRSTCLFFTELQHTINRDRPRPTNRVHFNYVPRNVVVVV